MDIHIPGSKVWKNDQKRSTKNYHIYSPFKIQEFPDMLPKTGGLGNFENYDIRETDSWKIRRNFKRITIIIIIMIMMIMIMIIMMTMIIRL